MKKSASASRRGGARSAARHAAWTLTELAAFVLFLSLFAGCSSESVETETAAPAAAPAASTQAAEEAPASSAVAPPAKDPGAAAIAMSDVKLIPRSVLFGNPQKAQGRLSPDGKWLSYLAPVEQENGAEVMNVWVAPADKPEAAEPVTEDKVRGIRGHSWAYDAKHIIYSQDKDGDENWHVYATNVETKETKDLTPVDGVRGELQGASERQPDTLLIGFNDRDERLHDVYRVSISSGERELVQENPGFAGFVTDDDLKVRYAVNFTPTGGQVWLRPTGEPGEKGYEDWETFQEFSSVDAMNSSPAGFDKTGEVFYYLDSRDRDTSGLFALDLNTGESELLAEDPRADLSGAMAHPTEKTLEAVSFTYSRREWKILDESIRPDIEFLQGFADGEFQVVTRTLDDKTWVVAYIQDAGPIDYYKYDREAQGDGRMTFLFANRDDLDQYQLAKMHTPVIESRDGLKLVSYLTLPPGSDPDGDGRPDEPVPMVLDVHGGPWARDGWGFNGTHQWLANRGYAVLSVNYRGSTGFGKNFTNAANGEWSGKMHDDLLDSVEWAVSEGIASRDQIAIYGGSYGGYATLVGLTYTPEVFACGVDIVGPSSLVTLMQNIPPYWAPFMPVMKVRVGDVSTEEGRAALLEKSPLEKVDQIQRPLLIAQGANDPRVKQVEADQIVAAMEEKGIPVTYALYPDEGHGFRRPENSMSFSAVAEAFLAEHLGGRYEAIGDDFEGSKLYVPTGAEGVPGLAEALSDDRMQTPPATE
ncbi:Prolyl tripeptidyl peptidase precursor [Pseudobythopirellula maris]|uniref:Prolyl tripeptidyl peptidase n=1 Tax=Pseudobythopirellula maris TaxID=2527991 RepID=A0A5C5ZKG2_9BACT|nr:S9 family peptidase [Pseudobythopirellula maris]TWT87628.1 Prolyl tripeptidyl peptidase precursor [Pseudobythopirellula maris]